MVGGGDGGVVREVLKYKCVKEVVLCEIDQVRPTSPSLRVCPESYWNRLEIQNFYGLESDELT